MSAVSSKNQIMKNSNKSKLSETSSSSNLRKSPNLFIRSDQELASFSEFSSPSSNGTFNKAKRASFEGKSQGPGPAAYRVNDDMLKSHSPKAVMPRETKRFDFVSNNETPGPNQYYPSKRALSRY